ncbi:MAG: hypothetical protein QOK35_700 [Pseudonocardiales bacterium]|nr:hypothetical protein [Pseudonocardiales bacterium]
MTGSQARADPARALDHAAALARADRILVTAHPAEPVSVVALRAGEGALVAYLDDAQDARPYVLAERPADRGADPPSDPADGDLPEAVAADALRRLLARHLGERLPDDHAGEMRAAVTAAAVVAALDLALAHWLADGARADGVAACRERFRAVAPLLPPGSA